MSTIQAILLVLILITLTLMYSFAVRVRAGRHVPLRPLPGFEVLQGLIGQAAEGGQALHVSLGTKGIGGAATATALASLTVLDHLAEQGAISDAASIVTVGDPTLLLAAQDVMRYANQRQDRPSDSHATSQVRFVASEPTAYAAGVMDVMEHESPVANVLIGSFGDEYLLMGETSAQRGIPQVAGTTDPQVLPFVFTVADHPLLGEEIFAAGAYLRSLPTHISSLITQDVFRTLIILAILIGAIVRTLT